MVLRGLIWGNRKVNKVTAALYGIYWLHLPVHSAAAGHNYLMRRQHANQMVSFSIKMA
jgi:hypothetical protein